jgi:multidrug efflux system membrane fusion protein
MFPSPDSSPSRLYSSGVWSRGRRHAGRPVQATGMMLVALLVLLAGCSRPQPVPEPVRAVRTQTIGLESAGGTQEFAAEVRARTEVRLGFRVAGKMTARNVDIGQRVRAGQVLAQLDPSDLKLAQQASLASTQAAQASFDLAAAEVRRFRELRDQGFISAVELDRRETTLQAQRSQLDQAKAQNAVQGNQASYTQLLATANGVVTGVDAEPGAVLSVGAPVLRLAHDGPRDAVFSVPEDALAAVRQLQGRPGALKVKAWGASGTWQATLREVAAAADPATRTFQVKADLGGAPVQLGQTLTVLIEQPRQSGIVRLPLTALLQQQGRTVVWLLDRSTMTVQLQPVELGGADGNMVVMVSGLAPGQAVVTAGVHTLSPGQKVKLYNTGVPDGANTAAAKPAAAASR